MKKLSALILMLLLLAVPCGAANLETSTPIYIAVEGPVYGVSAIYTIDPAQVSAVKVVFSDSLAGLPVANYKNGELRLVIASDDPLDLSQSIGYVTSELQNGNHVAPKLTLKSLKINGKTASCSHRYGNWADIGNGTHTGWCLACGISKDDAHIFSDWSDFGDGTHSRTCLSCQSVDHESHSFSYEVMNGELIETCSCGYEADGYMVVRDGKKLTVTLKAELYATHVYAARYNDKGHMLEVKCVEVTDTVTELEFASGTGYVKVFFLTDAYVPWLSSLSI